MKESVDMEMNNLNVNMIDDLVVPRHIAIILDGNGTWAKQRKKPRIFGHKQGAKALIDIVRYASEIKLECLTVYCFSTENWNRPHEEVSYLMRLLKSVIRTYRKDLLENNAVFRMIGTEKNLTKDQLDMIHELEESTKNNTGLKFNVAFNYGSHEEILNAVKNIIKDGVKAEDVDAKLFENYLYTKGLPPVDLMIRTSRQIRISNYLLWQIAYSELYFPNILWPDFKREDLYEAIVEYNKRERRFGGIKK